MTHIQPQPPFALSTDDEGTQHAIRDDIKISVLSDVPAKIDHLNANRPFQGKAFRWLVIELENNIKIYVHGTHVLVSKKDLVPTFKESETLDELLEQAFKTMKVEKIDGRYTAKTEFNKKVLEYILDRATSNARLETVSAVNFLKAKLESE